MLSLANQLNPKFIVKTNTGFSLLEILIAIALAALISGVVINNLVSGRKPLDQVIDDLERTVIFATNETILRGAIVRIKIDVDATPHKYLVEYGPKSGFVIPEFKDFDEKTSLSLSEEEALTELKKKVDQQFQPVSEFSEKELSLPEGVKLIGHATSSRGHKFSNEESLYIYFYPTGEKDSAFVLFADDQSILAFEVFPFVSGVKTQFYNIDINQVSDLDEYLVKRGKEIYEEWFKQK
jgi:prepilin-type N-terminal cleavage/methylation domain-containing protein